MSKILVIGANGKTGRRVTDKLKNLNIDVRASSRSTEIPFDWEKPETWGMALDGIEKVYITFQPDLAVPSAVETIRNFVKLASQHDVKKMVLLSGRGEKEAERCENELINSGVDFSIVRASWFMQNFSESFFTDGILQGELVVPQIEALEPFVDADDIADVVVDCLLNDKHKNKIYSLTGPELLSFKRCADKVSEAAGFHVTCIEIPLADYLDGMRQHHYPEDVIWLVQYLFTEVLDGRNEFITDHIEEVLGRKPRSFEDYAINAAKSGMWIKN
ncbi:MAG: NmrA family transcriptional regulator [Pedobacter sp.]|nr:MAG: NmrA family transcriptional regulator [Pedobacter sp.]